MKFKTALPAVFLLAAGAVMVGLTVAGCPKSDPSPNPEGGGAVYESGAELLPEALPYEKGTLIYGGTPLPVTLSKEEGENNETVIALHQEGLAESLETERYIADDTGFRYAGGKEESFDPAIPLINQYPFSSASDWTWSGEMIYAGQTFPAKAKIHSEPATLNLAAGSFNTIFVTVELEIAGITSNQPKTLKFWLAPGDGVVRREFTATSTREPAASPP